jgi:hypothetical protein
MSIGTTNFVLSSLRKKAKDGSAVESHHISIGKEDL